MTVFWLWFIVLLTYLLTYLLTIRLQRYNTNEQKIWPILMARNLISVVSFEILP